MFESLAFRLLKSQDLSIQMSKYHGRLLFPKRKLQFLGRPQKPSEIKNAINQPVPYLSKSAPKFPLIINGLHKDND
jgi:hypothetical protein